MDLICFRSATSEDRVFGLRVEIESQMQLRRTRKWLTPLPIAVRSLGALALVGLCHGCASAPSVRGEGAPSKESTVLRSCDPDKDREAILRMAGAFDVEFAFDETRPLVEGYEPKERYTAAASEVVLVLESSPQRIVLQHILLIAQDEGPAFPLKHWRQDWVFEDTELLEFQGKGVWRHRQPSREEVTCTWSQSVHQVDDGPRYEGMGRFTHDDGTATWTSEETWRPLPRREYTKRDDYDVLIAVNRHVIADDGWRHEQTNRKWVIDDSRALVEERGLNTYRRTELDDAWVAQDYMKANGAFWSEVRDEWATHLGSSRVVEVKDKVDGTARYLKLFGSVEKLSEERRRAQRKRISEILAEYVVPVATDGGAL